MRTHASPPPDPGLGDLPRQVRLAVYRAIVAGGQAPAPTPEAIAATLGADPAAVRAALEDLDARHALVLHPLDRSVVMAHPFSAVETPFVVRAGGRAWWANCAWDTFGILAALGADGEIAAIYAEDGAPASLTVRGGVPAGSGVVHLLLPPRAWQEDFFET